RQCAAGRDRPRPGPDPRRHLLHCLRGRADHAMTAQHWIDPAEVERILFDLATFGQAGETGVDRPVYSLPWRQAQAWLADAFAAAGLTVEHAAAGNVWGVFPGQSDPGTGVIVTGSHVATQRPGGRFDGALGI